MLRSVSNSLPPKEYIDKICALYGDIYDDRIEDCKPPAAGESSRVPGENWMPGQSANHKSLSVFEHELKAQGIKLSSSKIRKILITGGCWSTERSRETARLYDEYTRPVFEGGKGLKRNAASNGSLMNLLSVS